MTGISVYFINIASLSGKLPSLYNTVFDLIIAFFYFLLILCKIIEIFHVFNKIKQLLMAVKDYFFVVF